MLDAVQKVGQCDNAHRDLKPDNIFLTGTRECLALADFGEVGRRRLAFTKGVTSPGGSPACLAPEVGGATHTAPSKYHDEIISLAFIHTKYGEPMVTMVVRRAIQKARCLRPPSETWNSQG
jgi:serine/threonine protein kinase